MIGEINESAIL